MELQSLDIYISSKRSRVVDINQAMISQSFHREPDIPAVPEIRFAGFRFRARWQMTTDPAQRLPGDDLYFELLAQSRPHVRVFH
jgi:hypothetical protein